MIEAPASDLLAGLASGNPDIAWRGFLQRYSPTILHIVRRYEHDPQRVTECFDHVCEGLSDHGFRRLLGFQQDGPAQFRTWLMAVIANLCVDWRRRQRGRFRPVRAVAHLPELEQLVYRHLYAHGLPRAECLRRLRLRFPDLTDQQLSDINARLFSLLSPQQRWQLGMRIATTGPQGETMTLDINDDSIQFEDANAGPEEVVEDEQQFERLTAALAKLPSHPRLLLRLRYEQDLTLAEVARLTGLQDPFRAKRQIQAALAALTEIMTQTGRNAARKTR
jgi:RNA polymerase sigma factor (sigma-70 family)